MTTRKIILISGGSDGLGKELASKFSPNHQVTILSHNLEKLTKVAQELSCDFVEADVTDYSSLEKAVSEVVAKHHQIDVLINNAGVWMQGQLDESNHRQIEEVIKVNTLGTIFLTKAVLPIMKQKGEGRIINIISQDGLKAKEDRSVYSASKWAITGFTKCLQEDLSKQHIGVIGIYPGLMRTALFEKQGAPRDLSQSLELTEVSSLVEFVINLPPDTLISDIGIKNINDHTKMDDTNNTFGGLNIDPALMTSQTGVPTTTQVTLSVTPPASPSVTTQSTDQPLPLKGVIDITPGAPEGSHPAPTTDITPNVSVTVNTPGITLPVDQGVIDITPAGTTPPAVEETVTPHLSDLLPKPSGPTTEPPVTPAMTTVTTTTTTPIVTPTVIPTVTPTPVPTADAAATSNPLYEDPGAVALGK